MSKSGANLAYHPLSKEDLKMSIAQQTDDNTAGSARGPCLNTVPGALITPEGGARENLGEHGVLGDTVTIGLNSYMGVVK